MLEAAGFVDVQERQIPLPFTAAWVRGTGRERAAAEWYRNLVSQERTSFDHVSMINGLSMGPLTRNLGWSKAQVDRLVSDVLQCVVNDNWHTFNVL